MPTTTTNGSGGAASLEGLGLDELRALHGAAEQRIAALEAERREAAFEALEEIVRRHGLSKAEVARHFRGKRRSKSPAKVAYRNPENPDETWTGRGRRPKWIEDQLAAGADLQELRATP